MVTQLKKRGMPVTSVEAAEKWRRRHLQFARTKGNRAGSERRAVMVSQPDESATTGHVSKAMIDPATAAALARVRDLGLLAHDALAGNTFELVAPMLRQAMQAVPPSVRQHVRLSLEVWDKLTESVPLEDQDLENATSVSGGSANDFSAEFMETFWYQVALGPQLSDHHIVGCLLPETHALAQRAGGNTRETATDPGAVPIWHASR